MSFRNTFGHIFKVHTFGESHGPAMGLVIDGCPAGLKIDETKITKYLNRRRPGQNELVTSRNELDQFKILSGLYEDKTLGTPIAVEILNEDQRSKDYQGLTARKGHADQTWKDKFEHVDPRGGGRSSGRETVSRVFAGSVARQALELLNPELKIYVWMDSVGAIQNMIPFKDFKNNFDPYLGLKSLLGFPDENQHDDLQSLLKSAKDSGESYGGVVKVKIKNLASGLGQPVFSKLKSDLAAALFSIGSTQGVILGEPNVHLKGSEFHKLDQPYGGIQGGISSGKDIELDVLFKPTSSVLDVAKSGRHDPCIMPRALVVVESMIAMVLLDHTLLKRLDRLNLGS